jgi:hypothetical protein
MKNRLFSSETILGVVVSFLLCSSNASAQSYIGGSFNFNGSHKSVASKTLLGTSVQVAPDFGRFIGDRWAVGIRPWIGFSRSSVKDASQSSNFSLGINPYARYRLLAHDRFGLWAEADPELAFTQSRSEDQGRDASIISSTTYSLDVVPVLTYQLNSHISLESRLNLFSFGLAGSHTDNGNDVQHILSWGLKATTKDIVYILGDISIGFLYKF